MEVHDNHLAGDPAQQIICFAERIIRMMHEHPSLKVDHGIILASFGGSFKNSNARHPF